MRNFLFHLTAYSIIVCILVTILFVPAIGSAVMAMPADTLKHGTPTANLQQYFDGFDVFYMFSVLAIGFIVKHFGDKIHFLKLIPNVGWRITVSILFFAMAFFKFHPHDVWWYLSNTTTVMVFYDRFIKPFLRLSNLTQQLLVPQTSNTEDRVLPVVD
jgi:hypothetical protein